MKPLLAVPQPSEAVPPVGYVNTYIGWQPDYVLPVPTYGVEWFPVLLIALFLTALVWYNKENVMIQRLINWFARKRERHVAILCNAHYGRKQTLCFNKTKLGNRCWRHR